MHYRGILYRALNPVYAREPMSGRGAELYGGRFNRKGTPALYLSLSIMTALREANQAGSLQPTTLVSYDADIENIFDTRDAQALAAFDMSANALATNNWRDEMRSRGASATQELARRLFEAGHHGLLVKSFAQGAGDEDLNIVLWRWGDTPPAKLALIDDEQRLDR